MAFPMQMQFSIDSTMYSSLPMTSGILSAAAAGALHFFILFFFVESALPSRNSKHKHCRKKVNVICSRCNFLDNCIVSFSSAIRPHVRENITI